MKNSRQFIIGYIPNDCGIMIIIVWCAKCPFIFCRSKQLRKNRDIQVSSSGNLSVNMYVSIWKSKQQSRISRLSFNASSYHDRTKLISVSLTYWSHEKTMSKTSDSIFNSSNKHVFDPIWNSNCSIDLRWLWIWIIGFATPDQTQNHTAWDGGIISHISFPNINQRHRPYVKR